ncbi:MerR family transcriptional regulator [Terribacillus goriensis]|uniref:helix-turn-helix domain-containing protein n=1 Tax=Terribacillus saccharophilus TaxID=361277 RepID=UPI003983CD57
MQFLTSGELVRLLDITKYTLRYYEEQQLIQPAFIDSNGYHMYGEDEVYAMAHVLLLKKIGFSIKDIKSSLENELDQTKTLTSVLSRIEDEMEQLNNAKNKVQTILGLQQKVSNGLIAETKEIRSFTYLPDEFLDEAYNLNLKKLAKRKDDSLTILDEISYIITENGAKIKVMFGSTDEEAEHIMPSGTYFSKKINIEQEEELEQEIQCFYDDLARLDTKYEDRLFIHEEAYLSAFYTKSMIYSLEVKAK